ncbi:TasA family protein [Homoserinimonas sp. A520]
MFMPAPAVRQHAALIKSMLTVSAAALGATLIVVATAGGTYGLWTDSSPVNAGVVESGSLTLLVNNGSSTMIDSSPWGAMFPGDRVQQAVTLTNTGTVPADVTVVASSTSAAVSDYRVEILPGACPPGSTNLAAPDSLTVQSAVGVWSAGQGLEACIEVTLKDEASDASRGAAIPLTIVFTATQKVA